MLFFWNKKKNTSADRKSLKAVSKVEVVAKPHVLMILDGWGVVQAYSGNAISRAVLPNYQGLVSHYPATTLRASGESVGLPWNKEGNSEVGHLNLGLGRIVYQELPRINRSISDGTYSSNSAFNNAFKHVKETSGALHLIGLTSTGGVHSSIEHLQSLLRLAKEKGIDKVFLHAFLDGRDTTLNSGLSFIRDIENNMKGLGVGKIATISGRFYAMDRDNHWDRIGKAYLAMTEGKGNSTSNPLEAIESSYDSKIFDEEFSPTVVMENNAPVALIKDGDSVIFFNFRPDRGRQMTKAFVLPGFDKFERPYLRNLLFVTMTEYEKNLPVEVAYKPSTPRNSLGEVLAENKLRQLRIAETEKYAHVTYFFNGGREVKSEGEIHELVPSPQVESYAMKPEMSAFEVTEKVLDAIAQNKYDFILINFANADMVGHTGNIEATIKAVEALDKCIGKISNAVLGKDGVLLITADHGNAEMKVNMQTGDISKEHTNNPVPLILVAKKYEGQNIGWPEVIGGDLSVVSPIGTLSDVAPTMLKLFGINKPSDMTGNSLIA